MAGVAGRSGRKTFVPTPEQRRTVKILVGLGIPQEKICLMVVNPRTDKPLDPKSLRKHFSREIEAGAVELHARIGNFIVATIFGISPPSGSVPIDNQHVRGSLAMFFAETRMGWKRTMTSQEQVESRPQLWDGKSAKEILLEKVEQIAAKNDELRESLAPYTQ